MGRITTRKSRIRGTHPLPHGGTDLMGPRLSECERVLRVYTRALAELMSYKEGLSNRAAINDNHFAIHKAVAIADHERGIFGKFFRAAKTAR